MRFRARCQGEIRVLLAPGSAPMIDTTQPCAAPSQGLELVIGMARSGSEALDTSEVRVLETVAATVHHAFICDETDFGLFSLRVGASCVIMAAEALATDAPSPVPLLSWTVPEIHAPLVAALREGPTVLGLSGGSGRVFYRDISLGRSPSLDSVETWEASLPCGVESADRSVDRLEYVTSRSQLNETPLDSIMGKPTHLAKSLDLAPDTAHRLRSLRSRFSAWQPHASNSTEMKGVVSNWGEAAVLKKLESCVKNLVTLYAQLEATMLATRPGFDWEAALS